MNQISMKIKTITWLNVDEKLKKAITIECWNDFVYDFVKYENPNQQTVCFEVKLWMQELTS